jgi:hypothetical protein
MNSESTALSSGHEREFAGRAEGRRARERFAEEKPTAIDAERAERLKGGILLLLDIDSNSCPVRDERPHRLAA